MREVSKDVEFPVGNGAEVLSVVLAGTTVVMTIGGSPIGESVTLTVVEAPAASSVVDDELTAVTDVLVTTGVCVCDTPSDVDVPKVVEGLDPDG